ncbi:exonuclease [Cryptococcus neoformans Bt63]|nr:exonuclease [Cryptococcus neoformans var. grubii Bt63]
MIRSISLPLRYPNRILPLFRFRNHRISRSIHSDSSSALLSTPSSAPRSTASFYISNVFPIQLGRWDFRPSIASLIREEALLEHLHVIANDVKVHGFQVENWEVSRKDGGVFLHFSYTTPTEEQPSKEEEKVDEEKAARIGVESTPSSYTQNQPGRLFISPLEESAQKHGGWPSWLGNWWAQKKWHDDRKVPGHTLYSSRAEDGEDAAVDGDEGGLVKGSAGAVKGLQGAAGGGRVWVVKGKQWTEDMNRFPSNRLRVEFDGPDVSQEMLYTLFRPYGRLADIQPPTPVPAGSLRFASVSFSRLSPAAIAINALHGYSTPTNTADFTIRVLSSATDKPIPLSRLRLFYERPLKAHALRDWISSHPRLVLPVVAFLIGTLSYTFFDPIRAFFVRSKLEGVWDINEYSLIKTLRQKFVLPTSFGFLNSSAIETEDSEEAIGKNAWADRIEAEKGVEQWLAEYPSTFITITGPPGSGKSSLVTRVLKQQDKPAMVIDCEEIAKAKNDAGLVSALADQTGYYPVFSFMSSLSGLIDLAAVGLIGQKAGFSTPVDQQLRQMLEIVGGALKDVSTHAQKSHQEALQAQKDQVETDKIRQRKRQMIARGWHDGRLDCVAGNGLSELGVGDEPFEEQDWDCVPLGVPMGGNVAPIQGDTVLTSLTASTDKVESERLELQTMASTELDVESETIKSLPIVVLKNFAQKTAKGDLWNVLAEWGASLVENKVAHVIVVTEGPTATKALTRALPAKPLNTVGLADADEVNALAYVRDKLRPHTAATTTTTTSNSTSTADDGIASQKPGSDPKAYTLSPEDSAQIAKLGGRMVDLENLVYKVRTGSKIKDAVDDIILRNVVELRKAAFGDDSEDAKALQWTRAQAWKVVSDLANKGEIPYNKMLQEFPFKGAEQSLKALEEHELVSVSYIDGRASMVKPGKPVFRYVFQALVNDPVFKSSCQIEYNNAIIAKSESDIKAYEQELMNLKNITTEGGSDALGVSGGWLGLGGNSAIRDRGKWLLDKMGGLVDKVGKLEKENAEMVKVLSSGR